MGNICFRQLNSEITHTFDNLNDNHEIKTTNENDKLMELLKEQTNDLPLYSLKGSYCCKVVDVYDGDTVTIILINRGQFEKYKLRMYGYDSPEMKPLKSITNREEIKNKAKIAKDFLSILVLNKICEFKSMGNDKYGRLLGNLYIKINDNNICINELMIKTNHGYPYTGGTKKKDQLDY